MLRPIRTFSAPRRQRGAILIVSLLLLLVLTIVGVTAMQMTLMQERMAGGSRDMNMALQGAEAALREGERLIRTQTQIPIACSTATPGCTVWKENVIGQVEHQPIEWWKANARTFGMDDDSVTLAGDAELGEEPQYVIDELPAVRTDGGAEIGGGSDIPYRYFYRITARSTGGSGNAETILQSTFARR